MTDPKFFIDTGDEAYIKKTWNFLSNHVKGIEMVGITTNPNAMFKCNVQTVQEFESKVKNLCEIVSNIRNDDKGVVYVQHPDSNVSIDNLRKWIDRILKLSDGRTKVGLKIPPYVPFLQLIEEYKNKIDFNVTGVADCSTALMCFTYLPRYVSLIPGRMEEMGVNANSQMKYIHQRNLNGKSELITGSMRTIAGLKSAVFYGTVPTIGTRVFDLFFEKTPVDFVDIWNSKDSSDYLKFSPEVNQTMTDLSIGFFKQMDDMGKVLNSNL